MFDDYVAAGTTVSFDVTGWTNPATTAAQELSITSYWTDSSSGSNVEYLIDTVSGLLLSTVKGECTIRDFYPTDGNTMIYATPSNYTLEMQCVHAIKSSYGLTLTFPSGDLDWIIMDTSRCEVANADDDDDGIVSSDRYSCNGYNETRTVEIYNFIDASEGDW